ncbi:SpoIID/LytB domain-containing protein [Nocardia donostiensis]|uniref:SpoIID/LytB domain-containing protein n=1 Tax=Nocardia donostiensis TaxID=1538463 RepID=UPI001FE84477|nr:SpoIID/LytB domain-containing protein [Nocardia donostiensis]
MRRRRCLADSVLTIGITVALTGGTLLFFDVPAVYRTVAGDGHGRGMSQHGALRNAQNGWTAERILEYYYPGATMGTIGPTTVSVRLMGRDGSSLDVSAAAGARVAGRVLEPGQVAHLTPLPGGGANVVVTAGCSGETLWQTSVADPWVYPLDPRPNRPAAEHLTLCGGGSYRGSLGVAGENGEARTVNRVGIQDYLLGVLPAEVQPNWANKGAAAALRAQAIAARSYALAEQRYPYAQTCDTTDCQVYPGTALEDPRTAAAVAATDGTVLLRDGRILRAEYSTAPDGGTPADIRTFEVGPTPAELTTATPGLAALRPRAADPEPSAQPDTTQNTAPGTPTETALDDLQRTAPGYPPAAVPGPARDTAPVTTPGAQPETVPGAPPEYALGAPPEPAPEAPSVAIPNSPPSTGPGEQPGPTPAGPYSNMPGAPSSTVPEAPSSTMPGEPSGEAPNAASSTVPGPSTGIRPGPSSVERSSSTPGAPAGLAPSDPSGADPNTPVITAPPARAGHQSPIDAEYARIGGADSEVGEPISPQMSLPENAGIYRMYTNGVIIYTPTLGAQVVDFTTLLQLVPDIEQAPGSADSPEAQPSKPVPGAPAIPSEADVTGRPGRNPA